MGTALSVVLAADTLSILTMERRQHRWLCCQGDERASSTPYRIGMIISLTAAFLPPIR